jgi:hypothetical protein
MFICGMVGVCAAAALPQALTTITAINPTSLFTILNDDRHVIGRLLLTFDSSSELNHRRGHARWYMNFV